MIGCSKKKRGNTLENTFEQKKKKPGLKFNPGLALIGLRTIGPRRIGNSGSLSKEAMCIMVYVKVVNVFFLSKARN